ncbi:MAG: hypothetical protein JWO60_2924 [Frankiales bacterium]|nr:hypothetical protein [Frankiales bacterium]
MKNALRLATALAVLPLALSGCSGSVDENGVKADVDAPNVDVPSVNPPDVDLPDVEVSTK